MKKSILCWIIFTFVFYNFHGSITTSTSLETTTDIPKTTAVTTTTETASTTIIASTPLENVTDTPKTTAVTTTTETTTSTTTIKSNTPTGVKNATAFTISTSLAVTSSTNEATQTTTESPSTTIITSNTSTTVTNTTASTIASSVDITSATSETTESTESSSTTIITSTIPTNILNTTASLGSTTTSNLLDDTTTTPSISSSSLKSTLSTSETTKTTELPSTTIITSTTSTNLIYPTASFESTTSELKQETSSSLIQTSDPLSITEYTSTTLESIQYTNSLEITLTSATLTSMVTTNTHEFISTATTLELTYTTIASTTTSTTTVLVPNDATTTSLTSTTTITLAPIDATTTSLTTSSSPPTTLAPNDTTTTNVATSTSSISGTTANTSPTAALTSTTRDTPSTSTTRSTTFTIVGTTDIDECSRFPSPCSATAQCINTIGSYTCTCNPGYSGNGTYCEGCGFPGTVPNGTYTLTNNYTAIFNCNPGFQGTGNNTIQCHQSGNWSVISFRCILRDCGLPYNVSNGMYVLNSTTVNSTATLNCRKGYEGIGAISNILCQHTGNWSTTNFTCRIIDCGQLPDVTSAIMNKSQGTLYGANVTYECCSACTLVGDRYRTCLETKRWSGQDPVCIQKNNTIKKCNTSTDRGYEWVEILAGHTRTIPCKQEFTGNATRTCRVDGIWDLPRYNCVRVEVQNIDDQVRELSTNATEETVGKILAGFSNVTKPINTTTNVDNKLTDGELKKLSQSLELIAKKLNMANGSTISNNIAENFVESASNMLDNSNVNSWKAMKDDSNAGTQIMNAVEILGKALVANARNGNLTKPVVKKNIALAVQRLENASVVFPNNRDLIHNDSEGRWLETTRSSIRLDYDLLKDLSKEYVTTAAIYRNMSDILSTKQQGAESGSDVILNGPVMAMSIDPPVTKKLAPPITIQFEHFEKGYANPVCSFWNILQGSSGSWSQEGCVVASTDTNITVCHCDHLTNFAVLMSPFKEADDTAGLRIVSIVGIAVSMLGLLITLLVHAYFWRLLRAQRTALLMNLCIALLLSYVVFIAGVDRTESKVICVIIAAALHYLFLVVFCIMLAEGIVIATSVLYVFPIQSIRKTITILAWLIPIVIVGISLGATQTRGYGNEKFCWLSIDNGLVWAFVGPVLFIVFANLTCLTIVIYKLLTLKYMVRKTVQEKVITSLRSLCILVPIMGISWLIGIFYINDQLSPLQYVFAICNGLQGFFIFVFHCLLNKHVKRAFKAKQRQRSSSQLTGEHALKSSSSETPTKLHSLDNIDDGSTGVHQSSESRYINWREMALESSYCSTNDVRKSSEFALNQRRSIKGQSKGAVNYHLDLSLSSSPRDQESYNDWRYYAGTNYQTEDKYF